VSRPNIGVVVDASSPRPKFSVDASRPNLGLGKSTPNSGLGVDVSRPNLGLGVAVSSPCATWHSGLSRARVRLPMRRVGSVCPAQGPVSQSASCPCVSSANARCPLPMTCSPTKTCYDNFFPNHPFNAKCILTKRQPHPFPAVIATFCVKG
jgi:hypothetical protein